MKRSKRSKANRKSRLALGPVVLREQMRKLALKRHKKESPEQRSAEGRRMASLRWEAYRLKKEMAEEGTRAPNPVEDLDLDVEA